MGTRLYYRFYGKDLVDESVFESQMDMLTREIGDRGKPQLPEAVPPVATPRLRTPVPIRTPAPAPIQAPAPAPAPAPTALVTASAPAPAPLATPERSFTPSVWSASAATPMTTQHQVVDALPLMERMLQEARIEKLAMRAEIDKLRSEMTPKLQHPSDEQLATLQARLESIHEGKLLTDEEFFALEDCCADFAELEPAELQVGVATGETIELVAKMRKLVCVSEKVATDAAFARQARRKFCN